MSSEVHGAPRKSRRGRLSISGGVGASEKWSPSSDDWRRFESEAGLERGDNFGDEFRNEVGRIVENYLTWEPFERDAPSKDHFIEKAAKAKRLANDLANLINELGDSASLFAPYWNRRFPRQPERDNSIEEIPVDDDAALLELVRKEPLREYQRSLSGAVHTIECAIEDALVDIACSSDRGFEGGDAWTQWIVDLAHTFEKKEPLKSTASKDTNRPLSPFVRFVKALQSTIEKKYRRHQTDAALSLAVANALKHKEEMQKREVMSRFGGSKTPPKRGKRG